MIALEKVTIRAGTFVLRDLELIVPTGSYTVLMGRTGAGKTTLLEAICGLKAVTSGTLRLNGRDVTRLRPAERGIGYVPQDRALFQTMTVREHLAFALVIRKATAELIEQRVTALARLLGIESLLDRHPHGLSGGEGQRVALGRALSARPRILCLDEPLSALDENTKSEICALLRKVQQTTGVTVLQVTHNIEEAQSLADHIFRLHDGRVERQT